MSNLLEIITEVADRMGLVRPTAVVGSSNHQARQLLAMANQEGREQARRYGWQALTFEKSFTTIAAETQTSAVPTDFDRFVPGTFYNRTKGRPVSGPMTPQEWADYKGRLSSIVFDAFRQRGDSILIAPTPSAGDSMVYEYVSKYWCAGAADTTPDQSSWAADTDITFLDDELFIQGVGWRFQRSRGLDYAEAFNSYEMHIAQLMGRDGGTRMLSMAPSGRCSPMAPVAPDGNWNLS